MTPYPAFTPYGSSHWTVLLIFVLCAVLLIALGRRQSAQGAQQFARLFALLILCFELPLQLQGLLPPNWDITHSLPFELCDLAWMAAACALWTQRGWALALTFYWGLTLTPQAMITPDLNLDFPSPSFILFWGQHCLIVLAAIYLTWGRGWRPNWHGYWTTVALTLGWGLCMLAFNSLTGANYLFVNAKPESASLLDLLGPWPWYLLAELALGMAVWALLTWALGQPVRAVPRDSD